MSVLSTLLASSYLGPQGPAGTYATYLRKTTTYSATAGETIIADTSAGTWTLTLPATPSVGDYVRIADGDNWTVNNLVVARNGNTIEGIAQDLNLDVGQTFVELIYDGTTWEVFTNAGQTGFQGSQGITGSQGAQGAQGYQGVAGSANAVVSTKVTTYTTGTGTFTTDAKCLFAQVFVTGGGGGGGGADSDATSCSASGGGGGGGTAIKWFSAAQIGATASYSVGGGGSAGSTIGGNGGNGSNSTFTPSGTGSVLTGGLGTGGTGTGSAYGNTWAAFQGGAAGTATNGDINMDGTDGGPGIGSTGPAVSGGMGGASFWGGGPAGPTLNAAGGTAGVNATSTVYGSGGSGAVLTNSTTGVVGGTGAGGAIVVVEYLSA